MVERLIRRPEVTQRTGLGKSSIYEKISDGEFPPPIKLGKRTVAWREHDIDQWIEQRIRSAYCLKSDQ